MLDNIPKRDKFAKSKQYNPKRLGIILPSPFRNPEVRQYRTSISSLGLSLVIHLAVISYLSTENIHKVFQKPLKQIEVSYQTIEPKTVKEEKKKIETIKAVKTMQEPKKIELLSKESKGFAEIGSHLKDISKLPKQLRLTKKQSPKIMTLDMDRRITVPLLKSEKISDKKYLSYNQLIRQKIKQMAYSHVDSPKFEQGEVYLTFVLGSNGVLQDIKIIDERTHASSYLRNIGLRSVRESNPFPPFPNDLNYPQLTFNVVIAFEVKN